MERFKRKLISGIIFFGIGIVLIIIGFVLSNMCPYCIEAILGIMFLVIGVILLLTGAGLLVHSAVIKVKMNELENKRMEKLEES